MANLILAILLQVVLSGTTSNARIASPYEEVAIGGRVYLLCDLYPDMEMDMVRHYRKNRILPFLLSEVRDE